MVHTVDPQPRHLIGDLRSFHKGQVIYIHGCSINAGEDFPLAVYGVAETPFMCMEGGSLSDSTQFRHRLCNLQDGAAAASQISPGNGPDSP